MGRKYAARLSWVSLLSVATDVNRGPIGQLLPYRDEFVLSSLFLVVTHFRAPSKAGSLLIIDFTRFRHAREGR